MMLLLLQLVVVMVMKSVNVSCYISRVSARDTSKSIAIME